MLAAAAVNNWPSNSEVIKFYINKSTYQVLAAAALNNWPRNSEVIKFYIYKSTDHVLAAAEVNNWPSNSEESWNETATIAGNILFNIYIH